MRPPRFGAAVERHLAQFVGRTVWFHPNAGNAGDSLIAAATYQTFDRIGLRYRPVRAHDPTPWTAGGVLIAGGGGNLVDLYANMRDFLTPRHAAASRVVLLPHGVRGHGDLIAEFGPHVDVICRDPVSEAYVREHARRCSVLLMHDMALALDVSSLPRMDWPRRAPSPEQVRRYWLHRWRVSRAPRPADPAVLNAFRLDEESAGGALPSDNIDVSRLLAAGVFPEFIAFRVVRDLLGAVDAAAVVNTDRLHVCIAALLIGKEVNFYDNSYGKNRSVYEFSLKGRFPRLNWRGAKL